MNYTKLTIGLTLVVTALFPIAFATAQQPTETPGEAPSNTTEIEFVEEETEEPNQPDQTHQETGLTDSDIAKISGKCEDVRLYLGKFKHRVLGVSVNQEKAYKNVLSQLNSLKAGLKVSGVTNTNNLNGRIDEFSNKLDKYLVSIKLFQTSVEDVSRLNCKSKPEEFAASLSESRDWLAKVEDEHRTIRKYLDEDVRTSLNEIKKDQTSSTEQ